MEGHVNSICDCFQVCISRNLVNYRNVFSTDNYDSNAKMERRENPVKYPDTLLELILIYKKGK